MEKETLKKIFHFIKQEENRSIPFMWKWINNEPIEQDDLIVKGDIYREFSELESLPKGLYVTGDLSLFGSKIKSLPKDLYVGGTLSVGACENLTFLPAGLEVGGNLSLRHTKIKSLPKGLKVHGFLFITNTPLLNFSDEDLRKMIKPTDDDDGYIDRKILRE